MTRDAPPPRGALGGELPELARCLNEPGYTPPARALDALLAALIEIETDQVQPLARALARSGTSALRATLGALPRQPPEARPRLFALLARLAESPDESLFAALHAGLDEPLSESRKLAARGLAKLGDARAEPRLLEALERATGSERKHIVDALAALGTDLGASRLATLSSSDADLERRVARARLLIERRARRERPSTLALDVPLGAPWRVAVLCRDGLADLLADELRPRWVPLRRGPGRVDIEHAGTLRELLGARIALHWGLVLALDPSAAGEPPEWRIARALAHAASTGALSCWTQGVPRFRVTWTAGGHHRALTWALARALREQTTAIVNDSHGALWTLRTPPDGDGELLLIPRFDPDPRFDYRRADVPAASHPTIAAALARFAGVQPDEVVWDPFAGSALELIERARLGAVRELWGSDLDPRALAAARQNLEAAGLSTAQLVQADALAFTPPAPSLILTNPPMGRRVARDGSVGALLERFVAHAARVLRPCGRLVWLSPLARRTERRARELGLDVRNGPDVDLGGFSATLQRLTRPG